MPIEIRALGALVPTVALGSLSLRPGIMMGPGLTLRLPGGERDSERPSVDLGSAKSVSQADDE